MWHYVGMERVSKASAPNLRLRLEQQGRRLQQLKTPEIEPLREFVHVLDEAYAQLLSAKDLTDDSAALVRQSALQSSFPALLLYRQKAEDAAWCYVTRSCEQISEALGAAANSSWSSHLEKAFTKPQVSLSFHPESEQEFLTAFHNVVFEHLHDTRRDSRGRQIVRRLITHLGLSYDQLGRAFNISGETIRRWDRGSHPIPEERVAELSQADTSLSRLLEIFQPERLSQVVRRKAELFGGETALDWIVRGRIGDVADRYEVALAYQA